MTSGFAHAQNYGGFSRARALPSSGIAYEVNHLKTYLFEASSVKPIDFIGLALDRFRDAELQGTISPNNFTFRLTQTCMQLIDRISGNIEEQLSIHDVRKVRATMSSLVRSNHNNLMLISMDAPNGKVEVYIFQVLKCLAEEIIRNISRVCEKMEDEAQPMLEQIPYEVPPLSAQTKSLPPSFTGHKPHSYVPSTIEPMDSPSRLGGYWPKRPVPLGGYSFEDSVQQQQVSQHHSTMSMKPPSSHFMRYVNEQAQSTLKPSQMGIGAEQPQEAKEEYLLLNYCLDDIEMFVDQIPSNFSSNNKFWNNTINSQSLNRQSIPNGPSVQETTDMLKKFKLALNLIARLDGKIFRPSAQDLANTLVLQLEQVVNLYNGLAGRVVSPLLTARATNFLKMNLNPMNFGFLQQLGLAWFQPKEEWDRPVEPYVPVFSNGMSPNQEWLATFI